MVKMKFTDSQTAFEYVIYMIVGSYFKKTKCSNELLERKMRLQYCEQKLENQYSMEETCISYVEKTLLPVLPADFWNNEMQVRLIVDRHSGRTEIRFICPKYIFRVRGIYKGRKSELTQELWNREAKKPEILHFIDPAPHACVSSVEGEKH
jgi:hypothetical protein